MKMKSLLELNEEDVDGNSSFLYFVIQNNQTMVKMLINYVNEKSITLKIE